MRIRLSIYIATYAPKILIRQSIAGVSEYLSEMKIQWRRELFFDENISYEGYFNVFLVISTVITVPVMLQPIKDPDFRTYLVLQYPQ
jgi:hypothetical protein